MENNWWKKIEQKHNITQSQMVKKGFGKNIIYQWRTLDSDESLTQRSVLRLLKGFPDINWEKELPTHKEIILRSRKNGKSIKGVN